MERILFFLPPFGRRFFALRLQYGYRNFPVMLS